MFIQIHPKQICICNCWNNLLWTVWEKHRLPEITLCARDKGKTKKAETVSEEFYRAYVMKTQQWKDRIVKTDKYTPCLLFTASTVGSV
jgi:hypothetical protein